MTELRERLRADSTPAMVSEVAPARLHYMPQLDALRAFAVLAVMFQNYYGSRAGIELPIGEWGVQLFFVLSGFLITGILLNCREQALAQPATQQRKFQLRQFYIRRALRILPLFYAVVLVTALINIQPVRETLIWHLTYTSNIYLALQGEWKGPVSHFWSLAVEEQFYLLWPFLILWLPTKYLRPAILFFIALAPLYKVVGYLAGLNPIPLYVLTIACLDALGIGALLALYRQQKPELFDNLSLKRNYNWLGFAMLCGAIISCCFWKSHYFVQVAGTSAVTLLFAWLIHRAAVGFGGAPGMVTDFETADLSGADQLWPLHFHKFMTIIVPRAFGVLKLNYPEEPVAQTLLLITINIIVASCSWFLFEKPINNLKKRFKY